MNALHGSNGSHGANADDEKKENEAFEQMEMVFDVMLKAKYEESKGMCIIVLFSTKKEAFEWRSKWILKCKDEKRDPASMECIGASEQSNWSEQSNVRSIQSGTKVMFATPGRLRRCIDILRRKRNRFMENVKMMLVPDAEGLRKPVFREDLDAIFNSLPREGVQFGHFERV